MIGSFAGPNSCRAKRLKYRATNGVTPMMGSAAAQRASHLICESEYVLPHSDLAIQSAADCSFRSSVSISWTSSAMNAGAIVQTAEICDLRRTRHEMLLKLEVASETCPYCHSVNLLLIPDVGVHPPISWAGRRCKSSLTPQHPLVLISHSARAGLVARIATLDLLLAQLDPSCVLPRFQRRSENVVSFRAT
jgi:hypothetical protein